MKSRERTRTIIIIALVAAVGGIAIWLLLGTAPRTEATSPGKRDRATLVEVEVARLGEIAQTLEFTGEVVATDSVVIASTKEGRIAYCPWREGDDVTAGEKLVEIDREVYRAEVQTARAALAVAEAKLADLKAGPRPEEINQAAANVNRWRATLEEARKAYQRHAELIKRGSTSQQSLDQARERMEVAQAELTNAREKLRMLEAGPTATDIAVQEAAVKEASAKLALAEAHLAECVITAPFDGTITRVHVRRGDLAVPRSPLVEMYASDSLVVRFSVPESYASSVRPGLLLEAVLDALPGQRFNGEVTYPLLDPDMRTRGVEAKLQESNRLMPNQFARVRLTLGTSRNATLIPAAAVLETGEGRRIAYVVEGGKAVRRTVELGFEKDRLVQVTEGVEPGEEVVVTGNEGLKQGAPVRIAGAGRKPEDSDGPRDGDQGTGGTR
ncbi:MAG: efflux RND transporter periplasmic adaptor subunit [Desulfobacteraceae bacterium]